MNCLDSKAGAYDDAFEGGSCDFCLVSRPCSSERMLDACRETGLASNRLSSGSTTSFFAVLRVWVRLELLLQMMQMQVYLRKCWAVWAPKSDLKLSIVFTNNANVSATEKSVGPDGPVKET